MPPCSCRWLCSISRRGPGPSALHFAPVQFAPLKAPDEQPHQPSIRWGTSSGTNSLFLSSSTYVLLEGSNPHIAENALEEMKVQVLPHCQTATYETWARPATAAPRREEKGGKQLGLKKPFRPSRSRSCGNGEGTWIMGRKRDTRSAFVRSFSFRTQNGEFVLPVPRP